MEIENWKKLIEIKEKLKNNDEEYMKNHNEYMRINNKIRYWTDDEYKRKLLINLLIDIKNKRSWRKNKHNEL